MGVSLKHSNGVYEFFEQGAWIDIRSGDTLASLAGCY
jgi:hypothetical protein